jgi:hypothetical protein
MAERMVREETWSMAEFVLTTGTTAEKGKLAAWDLSTANGEVCPGKTDTDLVPLGVFDETKTGDGTKKVRVRLFHPLRLFWWTNDGTNPVTANDVGSDVYIVNDTTVSILATGRSKAGKAFKVDSNLGVLVGPPLPYGVSTV